MVEKPVLTHRERFIRTILLQEVDRPPYMLIFGPWGTTIARWRNEGLTEDTHWGAGFDFDGSWITLPVNLGMYPSFEREVLEETADEIIHRDEKGIVKRDKRDGSSMPEFLDYPVKSWDDWEKLKKERFNPDSEERFPADWENQIEGFNKSNQPILLGYFPYGIFGTPRDLLGAEELLISFHTRPDMVKDMMNFLTDFWIRIYEKVVKDVKVDCIHIWEDMSYHSGMLISPSMFREFMTPCYKKITDFARTNGIPIVSVDSDGDTNELAELLVDVGVNLLWPLERQANNVPMEYRKRFPKLGLMGGFDKKAMASGPKAIDEEMEMVVEALKGGGYIPSPDHLIPHDVSWENFRFFCRRLKEVLYAFQ